jgi:hypothetical protein
VQKAERLNDGAIRHGNGPGMLNLNPALRRDLIEVVTGQSFDDIVFALDRLPWRSEQIDDAGTEVLLRPASAKRVRIGHAVRFEAEVLAKKRLSARERNASRMRNATPWSSGDSFLKSSSVGATEAIVNGWLGATSRY